MKTHVRISLLFAILGLITKFGFDLPFPISYALLLIGFLLPVVSEKLTTADHSGSTAP